MAPLAWWILMAWGLAFWAAFIVKTRTRAAGTQSNPIDGPSALQASTLDPQMAEVNRLVPYIRSVVRARGVPRSEEWDVVQSVLIGAWEAITTGRYHPGPSGIRAWVAEIARRQAAKYRRSAGLRRIQLTDPDELHVESPGRALDEVVADEEDRQLLIHLLDPSDEKHAVLIAHDLDGVPMEDIAKERHLTVSTAYRWRAAALEALREEAQRRA